MNHSSRPQYVNTLLFFIGCASTCLALACSPAKWHETSGKVNYASPNTGDPLAEHQTSGKNPQDFTPGQPAYGHPTRVCGHRLPDTNCDESSPVVERKEPVTVVDVTPQGDGKMIKVRKNKPDPVTGAPPEPFYVPPQYLDPEQTPPTVQERAQDRYLVVQNIASEKLRIYERCEGENCKHRLVLETDMVVGEDEPGRRTMLGSYSITRWFKFYQDQKDDYPAFYRADSPALPAPGADIMAWTTKALLPQGKGQVRGAFGWYTAYVGPDAEEQWLHGTWGWSADRDKFIHLLHTAPFDENAKLASHGCTRVENQAIAFMRDHLVPGTKVIRIYAKEALSEAAPTQPAAELAWPWTLTTNTDHAFRSDKSFVEKKQVPEAQWLDHGVYRPQTQATVVAMSKDQNPHESGNVYRIDENKFQGVFLVDAGRLAGYQHPKDAKLKVGGHPDHHLPKAILQP